MTETETLIGVHAVQEALVAGRRRCHILWIKYMEALKPPHRHLLALARRRHVDVRRGDDIRIFRNLERSGAHHQGCALEASPLPLADWDEVWTCADVRGEPPLLLVADHIQDPQNLGALMRTAENCGVHGVIMPKDRACPLSPAVSQASAGGLEHMRIVRVVNLARTLKQLQARHVWVGGLESGDSTAQDIDAVDLDRPLALVVGNEGAGLSANVRKSCDFLLRLRMWGRIDSFNVANAASISLYLARQARQGPQET